MYETQHTSYLKWLKFFLYSTKYLGSLEQLFGSEPFLQGKTDPNRINGSS